jgi:uncharacterized OsmC-like protein
MPYRLIAWALLLAALAGCSTITPRKTLDRMIEDCMREEGRTEDECQQQRGCEPGLTRAECRHTRRRSLDIGMK